MADQDIIDARIALAMTWVQSVTQPILKVFYSLNDFELKSNHTEVTAADRDTEKDFRELIGKTYPDDGIVGEEFSDYNRDGKEFTWTIDPIDGTRAFVRGVPLFGTMIGLYQNNQVIFGLIAYHALGEIIYARKDQGCFWKSSHSSDFTSVHVSKTQELDQAVLSFSGEEYFVKANRKGLLKQLKSKTQFHRTWGDCYGYALLARGKIDVMIDPFLYPWDFVPLKIIVEEAGGCVRDIDGFETDIHSTSAVCANPTLIDTLFEHNNAVKD